MIASSPVRHDSPLNLHGLEVTSYQPPWKALSDFALNADLDNNGSLNHTPAFQHLVNQVRLDHFSYFHGSICTNKNCLALLPFFHQLGLALVSTYSFLSVLVPSTFNFFLLFICVSLRRLLFEFLLLCLILLIFFSSLKSAKLFLQIIKMAIVAGMLRWLSECFCTWKNFIKTSLLIFHKQMHGFEMGIGMSGHGPPPPPPMNQLPMEHNSQHHPDSTDSYVTYLESDESMQGSP